VRPAAGISAGDWTQPEIQYNTAVRTLGPPLDAVFRAMEFWGIEKRFWKTNGMTGDILVKILEILDAAKARWVLVGGTAIAYFEEPRATLDTGLIVESTKMRTVLARVRKAFPGCAIEEFEAVCRLKPYGIDFIKSAGHPLYTEAIRKREKRGDLYVPPVEIFLGLKFLAARGRGSPRRPRSRQAHHDVAAGKVA